MLKHYVERRRKEVAIRKTLGAGVQQIFGLLATGFLGPVLLSQFIAIPIAWVAMHSWLQSYAYRTNLSPWIFTGASGLSISIAMFTISFRTLKAAIANPADGLRSE